MTERQAKNLKRFSKMFPNVPHDQLQAITALIQSEADDRTHELSHNNAVKTAATASVDARYATPEMPKINAVSDAQREFAETVRSQKIKAIRDKMINLETTIAEVRASGGNPSRFETVQAELNNWIKRLATVTSAKKILDVKDNDLANLTPVAASIVAGKLGVKI